MEISLYRGTGKHGYSVYLASLVSPNPTGHNYLKYMLITCWKNPTMLEHTTIEGTFDFNKTPLAPPGINVLVHKNRNSVKLGESME